MIRGDALEHDVIILNPVMASDEVVILSRTLDLKNVYHDVTDVFNNFNPIVYMFCALSFFLVIVVLNFRDAFIETRSIDRKFFPILRIYRSMFKRAYKTIYKILKLLLDQENNQAKQLSKRLTWLSLNIVIYVGVFGILLNLMGTGLSFQTGSN